MTRQWARPARAAGRSVGPTFSVKGVAGGCVPVSSFTGTPPTKAGSADTRPSWLTTRRLCHPGTEL